MIAVPRSDLERTAQDKTGREADAGRETIWKVVHEVWQMLDDAESDGFGVTTPDQARWQAVSDAMDELEALVPDSVGPFWGGFPVNYFWPKTYAVPAQLDAGQ